MAQFDGTFVKNFAAPLATESSIFRGLNERLPER